MTVSSDGRRVVSASEDRNIYVWDAKTGTLQYFLSGHSGSGKLPLFTVKKLYTSQVVIVSSVGFSPDGQFLASGDSAGILKVCKSVYICEKRVDSERMVSGRCKRTPHFD